MLSINESRIKTIALSVMAGALAFGSAAVNATSTGCSFRTEQKDRCEVVFKSNIDRATMTIFATAKANDPGKEILRRISLQRKNADGVWKPVYANDKDFKQNKATFILPGMRVGTFKIVTATTGAYVPGTVGVTLFVGEAGQ